MALLYQIGEVCQLTGLTPRALHYYDELGVLVPSERLAGGQRLYNAADLDRIQRIKTLKANLGLSLSEVKRFLDADDARTRYLAAAQAAKDAAGRTRALEAALVVTEEQLRSVRNKAHQLSRLQRQLERQARELRALREDVGAGPRAERVGGRA